MFQMPPRELRKNNLGVSKVAITLRRDDTQATQPSYFSADPRAIGGHVLILALLLVIATQSAGRSQDAVEASGISVLSYNIRYLNKNDGLDVWHNRREAVCETLLKADIVGLQEVVLQQFQEIQAKTPDFEWYGVGRDNGQDQGEMTPIGWRKSKFDVEDKGTFWLSSSPSEVASVGWDAALPRIASWIAFRARASGQRFLLVNTHFDHRGPIARRESGKLLRGWIQSHRADRPAILIGDLNAQLDDEPLHALLDTAASADAPLLDARGNSKQDDAGPESTWNGFQAIAQGRRIDHILITGPVAVLEFQTLDPRTPAGRFASDHLPIRAVVGF